MKYLTWVMYGAMAVLAVVGIQLVTLSALGLLDPVPDWYVVDAPSVVRVFIDERGATMSEEDLASAILVFDQLVMEEANSVYLETGHRLVNSNHVLAGANDVSIAFAHRVVARWDAIQ
jgi:hypothetical protein